jgi:hypothetical protein
MFASITSLAHRIQLGLLPLAARRDFRTTVSIGVPAAGARQV